MVGAIWVRLYPTSFAGEYVYIQCRTAASDKYSLLQRFTREKREKEEGFANEGAKTKETCSGSVTTVVL